MSKFKVTYVVEVEAEDSMEVGDFTIHDDGAPGDCFVFICEQAHPGQFMPLDDDGVIIAPEPGVYSYFCVVDTDAEKTTVISSRQLDENEVNAFYGEIDFPDAAL